MRMKCILAHQSISTTTPHAPHATTRTRTHIRLCILVGAGIQQQLCAVRVTLPTGQNQRRESVLRAAQCAAHMCVAAAQPHADMKTVDMIQVNEISSSQENDLKKIMCGTFKIKISSESKKHLYQRVAFEIAISM